MANAFYPNVPIDAQRRQIRRLTLHDDSENETLRCTLDVISLDDWSHMYLAL
jgi:hypothetical protein